MIIILLSFISAYEITEPSLISCKIPEDCHKYGFPYCNMNYSGYEEDGFCSFDLTDKRNQDDNS